MSLVGVAQYNYDENRECRGCSDREENNLSRYILAFQVADELLRRYEYHWSISRDEITLNSCDFNNEIRIGFNSGLLRTASTEIDLLENYDSFAGVKGLTDFICEQLELEQRSGDREISYVFDLLTKLVQIFHARCNLRIIPGDFVGTREWEISIGDDEAKGWLNEKGIARNRFGQVIDTKNWRGLRTEKAATYLFGFNSFCQNFRSPAL
jgi:hypothetical protein